MQINRVVRPFLDLLPYRVDQALIGRGLRRIRTLRRRAARIYPRTEAPGQPGKLFVDLSVISKHDAGTGIQRVVRSLATSLVDEARAEGWDLQFVAATRKRPYHRISWPETITPSHFDAIEARSGDVFVGLDYSLDTVRRHRGQLSRFRQTGGELWFLVHDLLPLEHPEWFGRNTVIRYKAWLDVLAGLAHGFLCNSHQTQTELREVLSRDYGLAENYVTAILPMGHRISSRLQNQENDGPAVDPVRRPETCDPFFLTVGTLEPRKGHDDIIAAFDTLWQAGMQEALVLVGRMGWQVDNLRDRILTHPLFGTKLFWFDDVDDPELERMYAVCLGSIIASHAEGFGLPLIEALGYGRPVLARDLPVFRPHAQYGTCYFPANADVSILAQHISQWAENVRAGRVVVTSPSTSWDQSAKDIIAAITLGKVTKGLEGKA